MKKHKKNLVLFHVTYPSSDDDSIYYFEENEICCCYKKVFYRKDTRSCLKKKLHTKWF